MSRSSARLRWAAVAACWTVWPGCTGDSPRFVGEGEGREPPVASGAAAAASLENGGPPGTTPDATGEPEVRPGMPSEGPPSEPTSLPPCAPCNDFPAQPLFLDGLGPEVRAAFEPAVSGTPPCIIEPADGMLIPVNLLRPRVRFTAQGSLHQITISTPREVNPLVIYTMQSTWTMSAEHWGGLSQHVIEEDITVTVKTTDGNTPPSQAQVQFRIAPVPVDGSMVYLAATTEQPGLDTTRLMALVPGAEAAVTLLRPSDVRETMLGDNGRVKRAEYGATAGATRCVGCHAATGDGKAVITSDYWPWNLAVSDISAGPGGRPADVTEFGAFLLQMPWLGLSTTSRAAWANEKRLITSAAQRAAMSAAFTPAPGLPHQDMGFGSRQTQGDGLLWINLAAEGTVPLLEGDQYEQDVGAAMLAAKGTGWGVVTREGDPGGAVFPDWSHDGSTIAYASTDAIADGRIGPNANVADLYTVPYAGGAGGIALPVPGASTPGVGEYHPDFSPDDRFLAFTRVDDRQGRKYDYHDRGEIYVIPTSGGTATRLAANDPPACSNEYSPGVLNSWPKWSPTVRVGAEGTPNAGKRYYFVLFSSARQSPFRLGQAPASQLYLAAVVEQPSGEMLTYPAMYLWNQAAEFLDPAADDPQLTPVQTSNLTPSFDEFAIQQRLP
jgi:hypothetical protein